MIEAANRAFTQRAEVEYDAITVNSANYVATAAPCNIAVTMPFGVQQGVSAADTLSRIVVLEVQGGQLVATADASAFINAHFIGPLTSGRRPGLALFPEVAIRDLATTEEEVLVGIAPEVGGVTQLAGSMWISTNELATTILRQVAGAHEMAHMLTGIGESQIGDWHYVMNLLARPGDYYHTYRNGAVWPLDEFRNFSDYHPARTPTPGGQCDLMRASSAYLR